jgi:hypothetical protein
MARNAMAKKSVSDNGELVFTFSDGTVLNFDPNAPNISDEIRKQAMYHGFSQKIGDSYAGAKSVEDAIAAASATINQLPEGWNARREAGEGPDTGLLLEAIMRVNNVPAERKPEMAEKLKALPAEGKAKLRQEPPIVAMIGQIKTERAEKKGSVAADLLSQFA